MQTLAARTAPTATMRRALMVASEERLAIGQQGTDGRAK
jgi:hypothetical protein